MRNCELTLCGLNMPGDEVHVLNWLCNDDVEVKTRYAFYILGGEEDSMLYKHFVFKRKFLLV